MRQSSLRASSGMMILIARVYFYVPHSFIRRKLRTSCLCKREEIKIILFLISTWFHFRKKKKNRLHKTELSEKRLKNRFLFFLKERLRSESDRIKQVIEPIGRKVVKEYSCILVSPIYNRFDLLFFT